VDSSDLPLNVSREMLQDDAIIRRIRKNLVSRILKELKELQEKQAAEYASFFRQFGRVLKEGVFLEPDNADKVKDLLLFPSNKTDGDQLLSLRDYVGRMPSDQKELYSLSGESLDAARHSPLLEAFRSRGYEVLLFTDPMDEWMAPHLTEYDGKPLRAIDRGALDLGTEEEKKQAEARLEQSAKEHRQLLDWMQERMKDDIKEVRFSSRLTDSACCLVTDEDGINANMERVLRAMNQPVPHVKRILELNPGHPVLARMEALFAKDKENPRLADYADLLYGQALLAEGSALKDPGRFTSLVSDLMVSAGG
jgi:molecular chaperone HtpG